MTGLRLLLLVLVLMPNACRREGTNGPQPQDSPKAPSVSQAMQEDAMADKLELIDDDALKACLQTRGFVARVEVREAKVVAAGTRSESARIAAQVQEVLHGDAEGRIEVWRYTHGGDALLAKGKNYIVAVSGRGDGTAKPFVLNGYAVVRPGVEEASVKAHRAAIQRLTESQ